MRGVHPRPGNSGLVLLRFGYIAVLFYLCSRTVIKRLEARSRKCQRVGYECALSTRIERDGRLSGCELRFANKARGLICFAHKRNLMRQPATNWHDGQITKSLSSPSRRNILLSFSRKSVA